MKRAFLAVLIDYREIALKSRPYYDNNYYSMSMFIVKQTSIATFLAEIIRTIRKTKKKNMTTEFKRAMNNYNVLCDIFL